MENVRLIIYKEMWCQLMEIYNLTEYDTIFKFFLFKNVNFLYNIVLFSNDCEVKINYKMST